MFANNHFVDFDDSFICYKQKFNEASFNSRYCVYTALWLTDNAAPGKFSYLLTYLHQIWTG